MIRSATNFLTRGLLALGLVLTVGCASSRNNPIQTTSRIEPNYLAPSPGRFIVLEVACIDDHPNGVCSQANVNDHLKSATHDLELDGHTFIPASDLLADTRRRVQMGATVDKWGEEFLRMMGSLKEEATFNDLPPSAQRELAASIEAHGLVRASVTEDYDNISGARVLEAQVRVTDGPDIARAGATVRCSRRYGVNLWRQLYDEEIPGLFRCALDKALSRPAAGGRSQQ